jgi:Tetratricopeptide repeat
VGSSGNLADAYRAAGRLDEAIPLFERTLADCERILGKHHPDTLTSRNNLAGAYEAAKRTRTWQASE